MAKLKGGIFPVSGTVGDEVFVDSKTYDPHTRKRQRPGLRKNEPALKENYTRTRFLNNLASGINFALGVEGDGNKHPGFYVELQKRFRSQTLDNRYVLLTTLKGMDLHPRHTLASLGGYEQVIVKTTDTKFNVTLKVKHQPAETPKTNCYCYKVILLTWNKTRKAPTHRSKYSEWRHFNKTTPKFEFSFPRSAGVVHWLLCLNQQLGFNDKRVSVKLEGARIVEMGTFNKKDEALLKKVAAERKKKASASKKNQDPIVRVKATKER